MSAQIKTANNIIVLDRRTLKIVTESDAGAILDPLVMADTVIIPDKLWVNLPGFTEPQVDWKRNIGPYIYESGSLTSMENEPLIFKPNIKHYLFQEGQLNWNIQYFPPEKKVNLEEIKTIFNDKPCFTTIRNWEMTNFLKKLENNLSFVETRPNGISFLIPNLNREFFQDKASRLEFLFKLYDTINQAESNLI